MKTILIIEDNEQNLYLETFILEKNGFQIIAARDGRSGIELAEKVKPALILLDIQLPGMDGYAVAHELKRNPLLADVPIVAVTSYAMAGDRERIMAAGCDGYIEKPINPETFVEEVKKVFIISPSPRVLSHRGRGRLCGERYLLRSVRQCRNYRKDRATGKTESLP